MDNSFKNKEKKNILLSFPRSGNTWIRYIIEFLSGKKTLGYKGDAASRFDNEGVLNVGCDEVIAIKRHECTSFKMEEVDKLILMVRNYKEVMPRHIDITTLQQFKESCKKKEASHNYIRLIDYYDKFEGSKEIIYYEDLITNFEEELRKLVNVMELQGVTEEDINNFLQKINFHKNRCFGVYGASETHGKAVSYHSKRVDNKNKWDEYLAENYPYIFENYLKRYKENE